MSPKTALQLLSMVTNTEVTDATFADEFLHLAQTADDAYEQLLYSIVLHRPGVISELGLDLEHIQRTADLIRCVQQQLQPKKRKAS